MAHSIADRKEKQGEISYHDLVETIHAEVQAAVRDRVRNSVQARMTGNVPHVVEQE